MFGNKYRKTDVNDWETVDTEINTDTWFVEFDTENIETEGERTETTHALPAEINGDPANYKEAMKTTDRLKLTEAINEESDSMYKNEVWKLVDRNTIRCDGKQPNIIDSRWVLKKKIDSDGKIRYKAR